MLYFVAQLKSDEIVLSKSIFYVKNQPDFFQKIFIKENQFGRPFFVKRKKKSNFNLKIRLLLKSGQILDFIFW